MNERLQALAEQCTEWGGNSRGRWEIFDKEKFAELIVRECDAVIRAENEGEKAADSWDRGYILGIEAARAAIKNHFGVE